MKTKPKKTVCPHDWKVFALPGEPPGRVFQCSKCRAIGAKRWGQTNIHPLSCTVVVKRAKCKGEARSRLHGRGFRGTFRWACEEHAAPIEKTPDPPTAAP